VKLSGVPAGVTALVATVAIGNRDTTEGLVRNVVGGQPAGWRKATGVAGGALVGYRHLAVVPDRWLPGRGGVATDAIGTGRNMRSGFARRRTAVVASRTVGGCGETAVVHARYGQPAGRLVTGTTGSLCGNVTGWFAHRGRTVVATPAGIGRNAIVVKLGAGECHGGMAALASQLGLEVAGRFDDIGSRQAGPTDMASRTVFRRALEDPGNMAGLATGVGVHACQGETGFDMVEIAGATLGQQRATEQVQDQRKQHQQPFTHARLLGLTRHVWRKPSFRQAPGHPHGS